ncbi:anaerobic glycerol-3-phosphate dehydrogenase subunit C [Actinomyces sp. Z5]|uniref:anaerobic glycerol-3-phosphate dehydrogenase subunit C n=1 Tax=Actinomyces sp. Z5 TaxID=2250216 RepID=UPI000DCC7777|nr:anaerobic glycerol-3-phosphate dehydrogenase subunit C [Actinomyces sp. Z5]RAX20163.1 anaerobic glycerol-3-phosphate dehydrogenase subunit C [Actinomyces sp. Z5]
MFDVDTLAQRWDLPLPGKGGARVKSGAAAVETAAHSLARASLDCCVKCTICETMCPVMEVTDLFPGPKFVGPQAERYRNGESVDHSIDYCSSCGTCTRVCPQGVKIAELNNQARAVMRAQNNAVPVRDRLITQTTLMGKVMTPIAPLANAALANKPIRVVMEKTVGVHRDAPMPHAQPQSLSGWLRRRTKRARTLVPAGSRGPIVFFHGCAGGYFEVETSKRAIEVLEHIGYEVIVPKQGCCGLAAQSNGLYGQASANVVKLCEQLAAAGKDLTIVSSSGSCAGMLKHEAHEIMGVDAEVLADVSPRTVELSEFLRDLDDAGELPHHFRRIDATVAYHAPCQLKGQNMGMPAIELMELVPGFHVVESGRACCGIAGTYGLKKEKYDVAQAVGGPLFDIVREVNPNLAVCETETCRWQIEQSSGVKTVHPIWVLHAAYGLSRLAGIEPKPERADRAR